MSARSRTTSPRYILAQAAMLPNGSLGAERRVAVGPDCVVSVSEANIAWSAHFCTAVVGPGVVGVARGGDVSGVMESDGRLCADSWSIILLLDLLGGQTQFFVDLLDQLDLRSAQQTHVALVLALRLAGRPRAVLRAGVRVVDVVALHREPRGHRTAGALAVLVDTVDVQSARPQAEVLTVLKLDLGPFTVVVVDRVGRCVHSCNHLRPHLRKRHTA